MKTLIERRPVYGCGGVEGHARNSVSGPGREGPGNRWYGTQCPHGSNAPVRIIAPLSTHQAVPAAAKNSGVEQW